MTDEVKQPTNFAISRPFPSHRAQPRKSGGTPCGWRMICVKPLIAIYYILSVSRPHRAQLWKSDGIPLRYGSRFSFIFSFLADCLCCILSSSPHYTINFPQNTFKYPHSPNSHPLKTLSHIQPQKTPPQKRWGHTVKLHR